MNIPLPRMLIGAAVLSSLAVATVALAEQASVDIHKITDSGVGEKIGSIRIADGKNGATLTVAVAGIPAGKHGFHVHTKGDCAPGMKDGKMQAGIAAGEHYDPEATKTHKGPHGAGHKGDLPLLEAGAKGVNQVVTAPRLSVAEIRGRALVIHEGGDTYRDQPESGGGKGRIACGVVPKG